MVQDSSGHPGAEIPWAVFSVPFFPNCFHNWKKVVIGAEKNLKGKGLNLQVEAVAGASFF